MWSGLSGDYVWITGNPEVTNLLCYQTCSTICRSVRFRVTTTRCHSIFDAYSSSRSSMSERSMVAEDLGLRRLRESAVWDGSRSLSCLRQRLGCWLRETLDAHDVLANEFSDVGCQEF